MDLNVLGNNAVVLAPAALMGVATLATLRSLWSGTDLGGLWKAVTALSLAALVLSVPAFLATPDLGPAGAWLRVTTPGQVVSTLVQLLGSVIVAFSSRYLQGERGQRGYVGAMAVVLAAVQLLLLANHWVLLIAAWGVVGVAIQRLLCFYPNRSFALLAAHKKRLADRAADLLLIVAASLAWAEVGSGSLTDLWAHLDARGASLALQASACCLVLGVALRTALMPVHGWLIQVMEAPTPVSALLHAGVVNLGGFVLILFSPLLNQAMAARWLLLVFGLATAVLAGMVMLTRISIKVRLAWSTVAQMGFMLLECALGLYTLALLHLVGHSLYKAHAFLGSGDAVRDTRLKLMRGAVTVKPLALVLAPALAMATAYGVHELAVALTGLAAWPWWWTAVLGLAWSPMLWLSLSAPLGDVAQRGGSGRLANGGMGLAAVAGLSALMVLAHALPLGLQDTPDHAMGYAALCGMALLYLCLARLQNRPGALDPWRRWSYAGFYVDELYTSLALRLWPTGWARTPASVGDTHV